MKFNNPFVSGQTVTVPPAMRVDFTANDIGISHVSPTIRPRSLHEELALAVLNGDDLAANALRDLLNEGSDPRATAEHLPECDKHFTSAYSFKKKTSRKSGTTWTLKCTKCRRTLAVYGLPNILHAAGLKADEYASKAWSETGGFPDLLLKIAWQVYDGIGFTLAIALRRDKRRQTAGQYFFLASQEDGSPRKFESVELGGGWVMDVLWHSVATQGANGS